MSRAEYVAYNVFGKGWHKQPVGGVILVRGTSQVSHVH